MKALAVALVLFVVGCAHGADGLRQGCADANSGLTSGYQLVTGDMKRAEENGTAKKLVECFAAAVNSLDTLQRAKEDVCKDPDHAPDFKAYTAHAMEIAPAVAGVVQQWKACSANLLQGGH